MSNKRFVKVYIIHIPSIADFGRYVKEYQIPLVALLIFEHVVDPVNDDVHRVIIPGLNRFYMSEQGFAMSELGGLIVFDRIINLTDIF